jgi:glycosyltransferase involved in cell wall biosynthesis
MKHRVPVSAVICTLNEEIHIKKCIESLAWCDDIVVVDSYSSDQTKAICKKYNVQFFEGEFRDLNEKRNWALANSKVRFPWVLILDADERVPIEMVDEISAIACSDNPNIAGYRVRRRFFMWGRWLRFSSLYPTWVVRFVHKDRVRYLNKGHGEIIESKGEVRSLNSDLLDENIKGIDEWFDRQNRYSRLDAIYELENHHSDYKISGLFSLDPMLRRSTIKQLTWRLPMRGIVYFIYTYFIRFGFLDGYDGFIFCRMRAIYQSQVAIKKYDIRKKSDII